MVGGQTKKHGHTGARTNVPKPMSTQALSSEAAVCWDVAFMSPTSTTGAPCARCSRNRRIAVLASSMRAAAVWGQCVLTSTNRLSVPSTASTTGRIAFVSQPAYRVAGGAATRRSRRLSYSVASSPPSRSRTTP